jgi:polyisoprenoid-binding protein YceI
VAFSGRASRLAPTVRARFGDVRGVLRLAEDPNRSRVAVRLDVRTLSTGNPVWDDLLRAADPFRAVDHPLAQYVSTSVRWTGSRFRVNGSLDLGGVQTRLELSATIQPDGSGAVQLHAEGTIDPRAADIHLNMPGAKLLLPRAMHLMIAVKAIRGDGGADKSRRFALAS